jgi:hypothetical protein
MDTTTTSSTVIDTAETAPVGTTSKKVDAKRVKELFCSFIDEETNYSLDQYKKFVVNAYKESSKKKKGSSKDGVVEKRPPTKYNIFIKEEMAKLRLEDPKIEFKELMKLAANTWNKNKELLANAEVSTEKE